MLYNVQKIKTPVGKLILVEEGNTLHGVVFQKHWPKYRSRFSKTVETETPLLKETKKQLAAYFQGKKTTFNLPLKLNGTYFQNRVWNALAKIPFGKTKTYAEQAAGINSPKAVRAVGQANGLNPICIVLPCHRVIGKNGTLTGYGGGLKAKKYLLELEGAL